MQIPIGRCLVVLLQFSAVIFTTVCGEDIDEYLSTCDANPNAKRAIRRAKTERCRNEYQKVACITQQHHYFPPRVPQMCPLNDPMGTIVGCFQQNNFKSALIGPVVTPDVERGSPRGCVEFCYKYGYLFAGLKNGIDCICTTNNIFLSTDEFRLPLHQCLDIPCPGDPNLACGGIGAALVYRTGLQRLVLSNFTSFVTEDDLIRDSSDQDLARIVFFFHIGRRGVRQIRRILNNLYSPRHYYYIHVDKRHDYLYRELLPLEDMVPNIRLKRVRFETVWGGYGIYYSFMTAFVELFTEFPHWEWDFLTNLSDADFPILTVDELAAYLSMHKDKSFLEFGASFHDKVERTSILEHLYHECAENVFYIGDRGVPGNVRIQGGQDYFSLNREFLKYVAFSSDPFMLGMKRFFNFTIIPLEHFFQSVIMNSQFCTYLASKPLRYFSFHHEMAHFCKCSYDHIDFCACSPWVIQMFDWHRIERTLAVFNLHFIGRKFDPVINQGVIAGLELMNLLQYAKFPQMSKAYSFPPGREGKPTAKISTRTRIPGYNNYWLNEYHYMDRDPMPVPRRVLMESLAYLTMARFSNQSAFMQCQWGFATGLKHGSVRCNPRDHWKVQILETSFARYEDKKSRLLLLFKVTPLYGSSKQELIFEAQIARARKLQLFNSTGKLKEMEIGTGFDRNEHVFRNYAGSIGVKDTPSMKYQWYAVTHTEVEVAWYDPSGQLRGSSKGTHVEDTRAVMNMVVQYTPNHKPIIFDRPLYPPGIWKVRLFGTNDTLYGEVSFPVFDETVLSHMDISNIFNVKSMGRAYVNGSDTDGSSDQWSTDSSPEAIDQIVELFYRTVNICLVSRHEASGDSKDTSSLNLPAIGTMPECAQTRWSSKSPDPKSDFNPYLKANVVP